MKNNLELKSKAQMLLCGIFLLSVGMPDASAKVKGEISTRGKTATSINSLNGKIQVLADTIEYSDSSHMLTLLGRCVVALVQDGKKPLRLTGDKALIQAEAKRVEVQVNGGYSDLYFPFQALSTALKNSPKLSLFRLNWDFSMGSWSSGGSALYDRKNQTLREYALGGDEHTGMRKHFIYTGVTERMFNKMATKYKKGGTGPLSFEDLRGYGAVREAVLTQKRPNPTHSKVSIDGASQKA